MTVLSVNINKIATIRNSRGGNMPNVLEAAVNCEKFGAQGITVHPRPDERHIRYHVNVNDIKQKGEKLEKELSAKILEDIKNFQIENVD